MKIVVTSRGETLESPMDERFGRTSKLLVFDTATGQHQVVDNTLNLNAAQGAGIQTAKNVSQLDAQYVITGHCGPKAFRTLQAAGVKVIIGVNGTVAEAIEKFKAGEILPSESADVEGHWT